MTKRKKNIGPNRFSALIQSIRIKEDLGWGLWIFLAALLALSLLAGANFKSAPEIYVAGDIAANDIIADRDLIMEDPQATKARRKQVQALQPPVYDFSMEPYNQFQARIVDILRALNAGGDRKSDPALQRLIEEIGQMEADEIFPALTSREVQAFILKKLLPQIRDQLSEGIVWDIPSARVGRSGYIVRNLDNNTEIARPEVRTLADAQSYLADLSSQIRQARELTPRSRRAINIILNALLPATLTMNREATQAKSAQVAASVSPVFYQIQKGEILIRKGDRVSREQQLKLQTLYESASDTMLWHYAGGTFILSLIFSFGFFMSPSGKPSTPLAKKDLILISVILFAAGLGAKAIYIAGMQMNSPSLLHSFTIAYPVAGCVGLLAMVFAARRFATLGLLLSFFCAIMFREGFYLFLYYFLGAMLSTWLVTRAQSRQDVVWSLLPLSFGLLLIWSGSALLENAPYLELPMQAISVLICALLSLILLFALSPVLEMLFGYSTRFRLMELMSLDHPLMQEIMVTIPGTYHHSLVVANMVEAGAKAIGANSLLCKVAALYHDAGKINYPEYFIENQFGAPNKHDRLAPSMSALILLSHVKKGAELAEKYKLGKDIADIISQHHGTRIIKYFYQKAIDLGEKPLEADYSYPGPRPQSKEAAILMLADSVEASSRTLADPTPAKIKAHIDKIVKSIFAEGQLDESELTFKDLHYLSENFHRILTGIFHQRIAYPEKKLNSAQNGKATVPPASVNEKNDKPDKAEKGGKKTGAGQDANPLPAK